MTSDLYGVRALAKPALAEGRATLCTLTKPCRKCGLMRKARLYAPYRYVSRNGVVRRARVCRICVLQAQDARRRSNPAETRLEQAKHWATRKAKLEGMRMVAV